MKLQKTLFACLLASSLLTACSDDKKPLGLTDGNQAGVRKVNSASTSGLNSASGLNPQGLANAGNISADDEYTDPNSPQTKVIYFMLDSSDIQPDYVPVVKAHAQYLVGNPRLRVILEGNTDERGSREYNIALGEQRARAVANILKAQGVADAQVQIVSYGEEKPAATGSDESAWEQNRRVEIVYQR